MYDLKKAQLADLEGQGFVFPRTTVFGKKYQGVFFCEEGDLLNKMKEEEKITFSGVVYERTREREETLSVTITDVISTHQGERANLIAVDET